MTPLVSVIIPTRNRAHVLGNALASVFAQQGASRRFRLEVIVVDDASSDHTRDVVARYPVARYIAFDANRGLSAARNAGLRAATGDFIAFQDDDDLWLPWKLSRQVPALLQRPQVGVVYSQYWRKEWGRYRLRPNRRIAPSGWIFRILVAGEWDFNVLSVLIRRKAIEVTGHFNEAISYFEDRDFLMRLAFHHPFAFVPGPVAVYHPTPQGLSNTGPDEYERNYGTVLRNALALLGDSEEDASTRRKAWARFDAGFVPYLAWGGELQKATGCLSRALDVHPGLTADGLLPTVLASLARALVRKSDAPMIALGALAGELSAARRPSIDRRTRRRLLAVVWASGAIALGTGPRPRLRAARAAAFRAILADPFGMRRPLLSVMARSLAPHRDAARSANECP